VISSNSKPDESSRVFSFSPTYDNQTLSCTCNLNSRRFVLRELCVCVCVSWTRKKIKTEERNRMEFCSVGWHDQNILALACCFFYLTFYLARPFSGYNYSEQHTTVDRATRRDYQKKKLNNVMAVVSSKSKIYPSHLLEETPEFQGNEA
jgi:hypothetical protein